MRLRTGLISILFWDIYLVEGRLDMITSIHNIVSRERNIEILNNTRILNNLKEILDLIIVYRWTSENNNLSNQIMSWGIIKKTFQSH